MECHADRLSYCRYTVQAFTSSRSRRADNWEALYLKAEEDARNQILSAYEVTPAQISEEDQQTTTKPSQEKEIYILTEELQKENGELKEKTGLLTAEVLWWRRAWDEAVKDHKSWEEEIRRWQEKRNL